MMLRDNVYKFFWQTYKYIFMSFTRKWVSVAFYHLRKTRCEKKRLLYRIAEVFLVNRYSELYGQQNLKRAKFF